jgi:hypothetical protein
VSALSARTVLVAEKLVHLQLLLVCTQNQENVSMLAVALAFKIGPARLAISHVRVVNLSLQDLSIESGTEWVSLEHTVAITRLDSRLYVPVIVGMYFLQRSPIRDPRVFPQSVFRYLRKIQCQSSAKAMKTTTTPPAIK